jgi:hypothetical protein
VVALPLTLGALALVVTGCGSSGPSASASLSGSPDSSGSSAVTTAAAIFLAHSTSRPTDGGSGRITLTGRVGPLRVDRSTRRDVLAFAGQPDATGTGNFDAVPRRPNYFAMGYSCQADDEPGLAKVDRFNYCQTVFYVNGATKRLVAFRTSARAYAFMGTSPGMATREARRRMHRFARSGCLTGFVFFDRRGPAALFGEVDGGRTIPHRHRANVSSRISGGTLEALELESNRHPVGLLFC